MRVVRAFGRQKSESARFMGQNHFMARLELHVWWLSRLIELLWEFILPMASVALLLYGGMQVIDGRLSLGDLMMFLVYLAMLLEPMAVLATSVTQFQNNLVRLRPRARPSGRAARDGRLPRHARRLQKRGRRPNHTPRRRLHLSRDQPPGVARHRPGGRARRDDRAGGPERIGQDHALQPDRPVLRPDLRHDRARWGRTCAKSRSKVTGGCWESSSRTCSSSTARSPRTSPMATAGPREPRSSKPLAWPMPLNSSTGFPTVTIP